MIDQPERTPSNQLQRFVFERIGTLGLRVTDDADADLACPYISFGPSDVIEDDADCIIGRVETLQLDIWSDQPGQQEAKAIADRCRRELHGLEAELGDHALIEMRVAATRMIRDPKQLWHCVVTIEATVEEA